MSKHIKAESDWKFKRQRDGDKHVRNCSDGYKKIALSEIHHILCVDACSDKRISASIKEYVHLCMAMTDWDINLSHNNIGLPKKWVYVNAADQQKMIVSRKGKAVQQKSEAQLDGGSWDCLPCHQVDHPKYLAAVHEWVKKSIWDELEKAKKEEDCDKVVGKNIASMFEKASVHWKRRLTDRGKLHGGTARCLAYISRPTDSDQKWECNKDTWFVPFSMDPGKPRKREKPAQGGSIKRTGLLNLVN